MQIGTMGVDLAKSVFQVHGVDAAGEVVVAKKLKRAQVLGFFAGLEPCRVGLEACGSAHHWAREIAALGHEVKLIAPKDVKAYVRRNKTDAADAAASATTCWPCRSDAGGYGPRQAVAPCRGFRLSRYTEGLTRVGLCVWDGIRSDDGARG